MDELEKAAQSFIETAWAQLGQNHPLPRLFAGLMLVYYADESDLQWVEIGMRPWFEDSEKKQALQEREIIIGLMWILTAAQARKAMKP